MIVIGIDCAVDPRGVGIAVANFEDNRARVCSASVAHRHVSVAAQLAEALVLGEPGLLAFDAPLGWPEPLGRLLASHNAGEPLDAAPEHLFRRETDRSVRARIGKQSLDVGADRIARTAHAALSILGELRDLTGDAIPLASTAGAPTCMNAIEVYPAATLIAHGLRSSGDKKTAQVAERREILDGLGGLIQLPADLGAMETNADTLDAAVCVLAARDFLCQEAQGPVDGALAEREGWIWVRG